MEEALIKISSGINVHIVVTLRLMNRLVNFIIYDKGTYIVFSVFGISI